MRSLIGVLLVGFTLTGCNTIIPRIPSLNLPAVEKFDLVAQEFGPCGFFATMGHLPTSEADTGWYIAYFVHKYIHESVTDKTMDIWQRGNKAANPLVILRWDGSTAELWLDKDSDGTFDFYGQGDEARKKFAEGLCSFVETSL